MTCLCPPSTIKFRGVPELKDLAKSSCPQNSNTKKLMDYFSFITKQPLPNDSFDNNGTKTSGTDAICDVPPMLSDMKFEANRLRSFENRWPLSFIKPNDCAAVGLYYLGEGDKVKCAFCTGIIMNWVNGDKPLVEHVKHFPMCSYLLNRDVGNVPISGSNGSQPWQVSNAHAEHARPLTSIPGPVQSTFRTKYTYMACLDKRLQTFHNWHSNVTSTAVTTQDLAEAGFFYTGVADVVTCYCCGGQIGSWNYGDNAWTEHAKHYPTCSYVKSIKGSAFIEQVRMDYISENSACGVEEHSATASASFDETSIKKLDDDVMGSKEMETKQITENSPGQDEEHHFMCKICMDFGSRVAFIPCGHSLACPKCAKELSKCPVCRSKIQSIVRIYFD